MNTVLFYVQHLLGIGHVFRATRVARAPASAGARVLHERGLTRMLGHDELSAATLGAAVDAAAQWRPPPCDLDLDGASRSAQLLLDGLDARDRASH